MACFLSFQRFKLARKSLFILPILLWHTLRIKTCSNNGGGLVSQCLWKGPELALNLPQPNKYFSISAWENLNVGWVQLHKRKRYLPLFYIDLKWRGHLLVLKMVCSTWICLVSLQKIPKLVLFFFCVCRKAGMLSWTADEWAVALVCT